MEQLEERAKKLKRQNLTWNTLEFIIQWGIPGISGIGIGIGIPAIFIDEPAQIDKIFLFVGLLSFLFQCIFGLSTISFLDRKKTELSERQVELQKQIESAKKVHLQLDSYRDAMLFDQCDEYWKLLDQLNI